MKNHYKEDIDYFQKELATNYSLEELNEDLLCRLITEKYENLDLRGRIMGQFRDSREPEPTKQDILTTKSFNDFCLAIGFLECYLKHHFVDFKETEAVYRWAKNICKERTAAYNQWRGTLTFKTFEDWYCKN